MECPQACQNFLPFESWPTCHCIYRLHFVYPLICRWTPTPVFSPGEFQGQRGHYVCLAVNFSFVKFYLWSIIFPGSLGFMLLVFGGLPSQCIFKAVLSSPLRLDYRFIRLFFTISHASFMFFFCIYYPFLLMCLSGYFHFADSFHFHLRFKGFVNKISPLII